MRNRVARVARTTIATSKPKRSKIVADIDATILSTLYGAVFLRVEELSAFRKHKKHQALPPRLLGAPCTLLLLLYHGRFKTSVSPRRAGRPQRGDPGHGTPAARQLAASSP